MPLVCRYHYSLLLVARSKQLTTYCRSWNMYSYNYCTSGAIHVICVVLMHFVKVSHTNNMNLSVAKVGNVQLLTLV